MAEYGFPICQQPTAITPSISQPTFLQGPGSIFDDQDAGDDNDDNDDNNDEDDDDDDN